jgi:hypothetical protein
MATLRGIVKNIGFNRRPDGSKCIVITLSVDNIDSIIRSSYDIYTKYFAKFENEL